MKTGSKESQNRGKQSFFTKNAKKVLQKFGSYKNLPYLCTTFGDENDAKVFENGSLNYWLYLREKM